MSEQQATPFEAPQEVSLSEHMKGNAVISDDGTRQNDLTAVQHRFGEVANAYVTSTVHASGADLGWMVEAAAPKGTEQVIDVATGAGHTALAFAPYVAEVIAVDVTLPMLEAAQQLATSRNMKNIRFLEGSAQSLPIAEESVDIVVCRFAAHHFLHLPEAISEWARVLKPAGKLVLVDTVAPEEPELDTFLNEFELLRDTSHVRNHRVSEWLALLQAAGFAVEVHRTWDLPLDIPSWTKRMRTPSSSVNEIIQRFHDASPLTRERFHIETNSDDVFSFTLPVAMFVDIKPH